VPVLTNHSEILQYKYQLLRNRSGKIGIDVLKFNDWLIWDQGFIIRHKDRYIQNTKVVMKIILEKSATKCNLTLHRSNNISC